VATTQKYQTSNQLLLDGNVIYSKSLTNAVSATDVSPASSSQKYTSSDSDGASCGCHIATANNILTSVARDCSQDKNKGKE
jgi:hypothetical protein